MLTKDLFSVVTLSAVALYVSGCLGAFTYLGIRAVEHSQTQSYLSAAMQPEMPATLVADYRHYVDEVQTRVQEHCLVSPNTGNTLVQLTLDSGGNVTDLCLNSDSKQYFGDDTGAVEAVTAAAPFEPLPASSASKVHMQIKLGQAQSGLI